MDKIKAINKKQFSKNCLTTFDYINSKQRLINFGIKRKNLFLRLFARAKYNTKNPIKKVNINYDYNFTKTN